MANRKFNALTPPLETGAFSYKITAENLYTFSEEKRRSWLELFTEKSLDEI